MFDSVGTFTKQFIPFEGGYLYYPSKKVGGKLVTADEYSKLVANWQKIAGPKGILKISGVYIPAIVIWVLISRIANLPAWSGSIFSAVCVAGLSIWFLWAGFATSRLVKERPAIVPPRPISESKAQARALLNWRLVVFILLFTGIAVVSSLRAPERDFKTWAWLVGNGVLFIAYIWIAIQKFRDR